VIVELCLNQVLIFKLETL